MGARAAADKSTTGDSASPLNRLFQRNRIVRTRVAGVYDRTHPGLYLFGPAGMGKTHIILETLDGYRADDRAAPGYQYHRGHLTPIGLFELIEENCDSILVLDDVHHLFEKQVSQQILLAALGNAVKGQRIVKYKRSGQDRRVAFRGGIICISNLDLHSAHSGPILHALESRTHVLRYAPTDEEVEALILKLSDEGWTLEVGERKSKLTSDECREVAEFVLAECRARDRQPELRIFLEKALPDYLQCRLGETEVDWHDLICSTLEQEVVTAQFASSQQLELTRRQQKDQDMAIVEELESAYADVDSRVHAWIAKTGKSRRTYFRRLKAHRRATVVSSAK